MKKASLYPAAALALSLQAGFAQASSCYYQGDSVFKTVQVLAEKILTPGKVIVTQDNNNIRRTPTEETKYRTRLYVTCGPHGVVAKFPDTTMPKAGEIITISLDPRKNDKVRTCLDLTNMEQRLSKVWMEPHSTPLSANDRSGFKVMYNAPVELAGKADCHRIKLPNGPSVSFLK